MEWKTSVGKEPKGIRSKGMDEQNRTAEEAGMEYFGKPGDINEDGLEIEQDGWCTRQE